jgi:hypothetical protein
VPFAVNCVGLTPVFCPWVSSIYRATHSAPSRLTRRMTQMTGAAFQTQVSLNSQTTDPTSHTPVNVHSTFSGSGCHLLKSDDRHLCFLLLFSLKPFILKMVLMGSLFQHPLIILHCFLKVMVGEVISQILEIVFKLSDVVIQGFQHFLR